MNFEPKPPVNEHLSENAGKRPNAVLVPGGPIIARNRRCFQIRGCRETNLNIQESRVYIHVQRIIKLLCIDCLPNILEEHLEHQPQNHSTILIHIKHRD